MPDKTAEPLEKRPIEKAPPEDIPEGDVRLMGKSFRVELHTSKEMASNKSGTFKNSDQLIYVNSGQVYEQQVDTLLHELLHALDWTLRLNLNEDQVHPLAAGLHSLFVDNPEYFKQILFPNE